MKPILKLTIFVVAVGLLCATGAFAQQVTPPPSQFAITGFIQEARLNPNVGGSIPADPRLYGGTLTVNGIKMIVPNNSIIQMPATSMTWADLFDPAKSQSVGYTPPRPNHRPGVTGLALADNQLAGTRAAAASPPMPYPSYEVSVNGNVLPDGRYVVGLIVPVEQQVLNGTGGLINYIDYATGRFRVGGIRGNPTTGTLCEINDPVGRFGLPHSPDPRFTCDYTNPTITTSTGYPVGIPNVAPPLSDPDRPLTNRPLNNPGSVDPNQPFSPFLQTGAPLRTFTMPASAGPGTTTPDPYKQVPLMVGDWVDFAGTVFKINPLGPNTAANTFVSIYSLTAHMSVKTTPGTVPAYVRVEEMLFGVGDGAGGPTVNAGVPATPITQETGTHVAMVSFLTDSNPALVPPNPALPTGRILGIYVDPVTGGETEFQFPNGNGGGATPNPDFAIDDSVRGRLLWRTAKNPKPAVAGLLGNAVNAAPPPVPLRNFYREYILKISTGQLQLPPQANGLPGLIAGQYRFPIFEYIFGEGVVFGQPVPPNNYNNFGFLAVGSGPLNGPGTGAPLIGRLDPWPQP